MASHFKGREVISVGERERNYYLHVPSSYDEHRPYPLLMVFHMRAGNAWMMREITQFNRLADEEGFIVVYPDGFRRSWADGSGRYEADRANVDDLLFVRTLLAGVTDRYAVDDNRIYAAGFSNGGFFALRLACEMAAEFRAVATVSAVLAKDVLHGCDPERPVPLLMIHGTADRDLPWEGLPPQLASVPETVETWTAINGCRPSPTVEFLDPAGDATQIRRHTYSGCQNEAEVMLYAIQEGGHKWPGASNTLQFWLSGNLSQDVDATSTIWRFFEKHAK